PTKPPPTTPTRCQATAPHTPPSPPAQPSAGAVFSGSVGAGGVGGVLRVTSVARIRASRIATSVPPTPRPNITRSRPVNWKSRSGRPGANDHKGRGAGTSSTSNPCAASSAGRASSPAGRPTGGGPGSGGGPFGARRFFPEDFTPTSGPAAFGGR